MRCPNCHHDVPATAYCVRCGEPLENRASPYPVEGRGYAAAPHEHWSTPRIISSIYPHLPRSSMASFRVALLFGTALVVVLSLFGLFPLALIVAAVLLPSLTILYIWDVDLYEDEPLKMLAFTIAWGAGAGIGLGFATRAATSSESLLTGVVDSQDLLWLGVLLPLASVVLMLLGPLVLLPYRRFNDVLDGVTFGGACAVTLLGAEVLTNSAGFLNGALKAAGDVSPWIARLLTLAVAVPVLGAAAIGAAAGAFWLRYRAPARDRKVLGPLGSPLLAFSLAAAVIVGASIAQLYLAPWWSLAIVAALALAALVVLRLVIHLGLLEEAAEIEIGPATRCPNCGRETPTHTFCAQCGIALHALPKTSRRAMPVPLPLSRRAAIPVAFALIVSAAVGLSVAAIVLARPGPVRPPCLAGRPCGAPPHGPPVVARPTGQSRGGPGAYQTGTRWRSDAGAGVRYDPGAWRTLTKSSTTLELEWQQNPLVVVRIVAVPASMTPLGLLNDQLAATRSGYLGVVPDDAAEDALLEPMVGYVHGLGGTYRGTSKLSPSPGARVEIAFEVATRGSATVLVRAITYQKPQKNQHGIDSPFPAFDVVDALLRTFDWDGQGT
jgi:hypothetical protein